MRLFKIAVIFLFMVSWKQFRASGNQVNWTYAIPQIGNSEPSVYESDERTFFDEKQQAIDFIKSHDGDRKFWDFKLYELREVSQ